jgi:adenosyl cobinamide kinase/adenosyl cobinamide phosphate guanylyltransferase
MTLAVLLGGARCGKSRLAVELGRGWPGDVVFVATAEARDADMALRIRRHQDERPTTWQLVEEPTELAAVEALAPERPELVIVDCLPLWLSNLIDVGQADEVILEAAAAVAIRARQRAGPVLVVTNEVGLGVVPATPLGRRFRDLLGNVNQTFVAAAKTVHLVVAGRALRLEPVAYEEVLAGEWVADDLATR